MSFDRMIEKIVETQNPTVAGLDPKLSYIPPYILDAAVAEHGKTLEGAAAALAAYNKGLIDALCDIVPAVKPQAAYYEMYGWQGVKALAETVAYAREKGMFVITDGKRNDIGTTMEAYATAHLGTTDVFGEKLDAFGADALTVNGYLGTDGIQPLLGAAKHYGENAVVAVGFRSAGYAILTEDFKAAGCAVRVATDDGSLGHHGLVTDLIRDVQPDIICACGPMVMLRAVAAYAKENGIRCEISLEERMACGIGACLGCAVELYGENGEIYMGHVCKDGPVFAAERVVL